MGFTVAFRVSSCGDKSYCSSAICVDVCVHVMRTFSRKFFVHLRLLGHH